MLEAVTIFMPLPSLGGRRHYYFRDQIWAKISALEPELHLNAPGSNIYQSKRLIWEVLSISENFKSKGQMLRSPDDQIWTIL